MSGDKEFEIFKSQILHRDGWRCQGCLQAAATGVVLKRGAPLDTDLMWEFVSVCNSCQKAYGRGRATEGALAEADHL